MSMIRVGTWVALNAGMPTIGEPTHTADFPFTAIIVVVLVLVAVMIIIRLLFVHRDRVYSSTDGLTDRITDFDFLDSIWKLEDWVISKFDKLIEVFEL